MELTGKDKLLALGSALYLLGLEIDAKQEEMEAAFQEEHTLCSPRILDMQREFGIMSRRFQTMEAEFEKAKAELEGKGKPNDPHGGVT